MPLGVSDDEEIPCDARRYRPGGGPVRVPGPGCWRLRGRRATRHLCGDIYEVRADGDRQTFRILFANEGRSGQILLALEGFSKKTQKSPRRRYASHNGASPTGGVEAGGRRRVRYHRDDRSNDIVSAWLVRTFWTR